MTEEPAPYTTNGVRHGRQHAQDEELTMAEASLRRLHAALETARSTEATSQQKTQAFLDGGAASDWPCCFTDQQRGPGRPRRCFQSAADGWCHGPPSA